MVSCGAVDVGWRSDAPLQPDSSAIRGGGSGEAEQRRLAAAPQHSTNIQQHTAPPTAPPLTPEGRRFSGGTCRRCPGLSDSPSDTQAAPRAAHPDSPAGPGTI
ncbi:hypothetical protein PBY51_010244 [Eleginops maclovinus]|uniref:Uncharacterized protein n=1 Tax=Eleginops maclovinus TaxID=56733 RepID=A0AAN7X7E5_ELEMC|nr:hypothetical protein PBY51_010244 [Eleginops maclovinus]